MMSLLAVGRSYTSEPKRGKKQPRLLDLDPEDRTSHSNTTDTFFAESVVSCDNEINEASDTLVSVAESIVSCGNKINKATLLSKNNRLLL